MYGEAITRIYPGDRLMGYVLAMDRPMFPGNRSDRSKRSDPYPLSSGSLLYSGNARPMPKVAVSSDYNQVTFSQGYIEFKAIFFMAGTLFSDAMHGVTTALFDCVYVRVG